MMDHSDANEIVARATSELLRLQARVAELETMLRECSGQFQFYATSHWKKQTPEADEKGRVNDDFVRRIIAVLGGVK